MLSASAPPPLPPRLSHHHHRPQPRPPQQQLPSSSNRETDEPPPAYTPSADHPTQVVELGPQYPFGPTPPPPSSSTPHHHHPPYHSNPPHHPQAHSTQNYQPHPSPQTSYPYYQSSSQPCAPTTTAPNTTYPIPHYTSSYPPQNSIPGFSEPTSLPTPGRPLLYEDRILVYPCTNGVCYFCGKCCNTGFKSFDPNRPCRKCWLKYGRSWQVVKLSPMTDTTTTANLQRPLPPTGMNFTQQVPLVVRPGDPRIGGRLCLNCNGSGSKQEELNLFNVFLGGGGSEVCPSCRGTGRIFL